ncbi:DEKNAAC105594 [Brettanomyces naardenensis]|uniref:DEKNAAC105594 n=1 Tax=Brettanomyces naardenensis TaxID=13370 RepID=A0A448YU30_BRENA|nr:DEKNAAC105594 [Brettanomyces naardenensis]
MALKYRSIDGAKKKLQFTFDSHQEFDKCIECLKMWEVDIRDLKADGSQVGSQLESQLDSFLGSQIAIQQDYRFSSQQENNYSTNTTQDEYNSQDLTDLLTQYLPAPSGESSNGISTEGKSIEELAGYLLDNLKDKEFIQMVSHRRIAERIHYIN